MTTSILSDTLPTPETLAPPHGETPGNAGDQLTCPRQRRRGRAGRRGYTSPARRNSHSTVAPSSRRIVASKAASVRSSSSCRWVHPRWMVSRGSTVGSDACDALAATNPVFTSQLLSWPGRPRVGPVTSCVVVRLRHTAATGMYVSAAPRQAVSWSGVRFTDHCTARGMRLPAPNGWPTQPTAGGCNRA